MANSFRLWPLIALLAIGGRFSGAAAATRSAPTLTAAAATDPYNTYYPQGVTSAESYLNIQPDGSASDPPLRSFDEVYTEKAKAEGMRDQATSLNNYYYLSGYIDRLSQYLESGGH